MLDIDFSRVKPKYEDAVSRRDRAGRPDVLYEPSPAAASRSRAPTAAERMELGRGKVPPSRSRRGGEGPGAVSVAQDSARRRSSSGPSSRASSCSDHRGGGVAALRAADLHAWRGCWRRRRTGLEDLPADAAKIRRARKSPHADGPAAPDVPVRSGACRDGRRRTPCRGRRQRQETALLRALAGLYAGGSDRTSTSMARPEPSGRCPIRATSSPRAERLPRGRAYRQEAAGPELRTRSSSSATPTVRPGPARSLLHGVHRDDGIDLSGVEIMATALQTCCTNRALGRAGRFWRCQRRGVRAWPRALHRSCLALRWRCRGDLGSGAYLRRRPDGLRKRTPSGCRSQRRSAPGAVRSAHRD